MVASTRNERDAVRKAKRSVLRRCNPELSALVVSQRETISRARRQRVPGEDDTATTGLIPHRCNCCNYSDTLGHRGILRFANASSAAYPRIGRWTNDEDHHHRRDRGDGSESDEAALRSRR